MSISLVNKPHLFAERARKAKKAFVAHGLEKKAPTITLFPSLNMELKRLSQMVLNAEQWQSQQLNEGMALSQRIASKKQSVTSAHAQRFFSVPKQSVTPKKTGNVFGFPG